MQLRRSKFSRYRCARFLLFCLSEDEHGTFSFGSTLTQYTILRSRLDYFFRSEHISTRATFTFVGILYQILTFVHLITGIVVDLRSR